LRHVRNQIRGFGAGSVYFCGRYHFFLLGGFFPEGFFLGDAFF